MVTVALSTLTLNHAGCQGRSIKEDNPVFAAAPPRRSLVNESADRHELALVQESDPNKSGIVPVGLETRANAKLTATTIIATVNGKPVFVDDVLGSGRKLIEADPTLSENQRQAYLRAGLQKRLRDYCDDELVMQALEQKVPEEKRQLLKDTLEPRFQEWLDGLKKEYKFETDEQLEAMFAEQSVSIDDLRRTFMRVQMVSGYLASLDKTPATVDRADLVNYYHEHIAEFTPTEQVRFAEIVVRFSEHGGREGAEQVMATVVTQLQNGEDFGKVAAALSDTLSAERQGDRGWITRGDLADQALTDMLFAMQVGTISKVQVLDDRFEVYRVIDHKTPESQPFQSVQKKIEEALLSERKKQAREAIRQSIREKGTVVTIFDGEPAPQTNSPTLIR